MIKLLAIFLFVVEAFLIVAVIVKMEHEVHSLTKQQLILGSTHVIFLIILVLITYVLLMWIDLGCPVIF